MRRGLHTFFLLLLILSNDVLGNKQKSTKGQKKANHSKDKVENDRSKRSLTDDDKPFWANRGKKQSKGDSRDVSKYDNDVENHEKTLRASELAEEYQPFWGNRGRRDNFPLNNYIEVEYPDYSPKQSKYNNIFCKHCPSSASFKSAIERRDELEPFWGNRGRRSSDESNAFDDPDTFWGSRGRRQDSDPFWGNRGRRQDESPFWGTRGRRDDEPFWGNRGRRQDNLVSSTHEKREDEPFWGNRGRRDDSEPFWGNRGRRQESEPFWGNRGRREDTEPFWGNRGRRKEGLKDSILQTIDNVEDDIENLSRLRRGNIAPNSFWMHRGRDSKLKLLFNGPPRNRAPFISKPRGLVSGGSVYDTVHDNKMIVEEPHYILVERSSRSSAEDDPFFISRGKKYYLNLKAARDRRGAIEEIVKNVRNDPYYIARGKKDSESIKIENGTSRNDDFVKVRDLICSAIDLFNTKNGNTKTKREAGDNERDRRTTLKKLALQLQMDPYFVSRGKKDDTDTKENFQEFINDVATKCT